MALNAASTLEQLAAAAREGQLEAFSLLASRVERPLFRFLLLRCGHRQDAEELAQECLLRAWEQLPRYDAGRPLMPWLLTLAARLAVDRRRHAARRPSEPLRHDPPSDAACPAAVSARAESCGNLWDLATAVLDPPSRQALWLRYVEEFTPAEIGAVLGRSAGGVRVLLFRARRVLARRLDASRESLADPPLHLAPLSRSGGP